VGAWVGMLMFRNPSGKFKLSHTPLAYCRVLLVIIILVSLHIKCYKLMKCIQYKSLVVRPICQLKEERRADRVTRRGPQRERETERRDCISCVCVVSMHMNSGGQRSEGCNSWRQRGFSTAEARHMALKQIPSGGGGEDRSSSAPCLLGYSAIVIFL